MSTPRWVCIPAALLLLLALLAALGQPGSAAAAEESPAELHFEVVTDLPTTPSGSELVDLEYTDGQFIALVRTPNRWVIWRSPDGATWVKERLPKAMFKEAQLLGAAMLGGVTYVTGIADPWEPGIWAEDEGSWSRIDVPRHGNMLGWVNEITVCGDRVVFQGSDSASNHLAPTIWGFNRKGELKATGFPSSMPGGPAYAVLCRGRRFASFIADGQPPGAAVDVANDVWVSATGARWRLKAEDVLDPPLLLSNLDRAGDRWVAASQGETMAGSHDGVLWEAIDTLPPSDIQGPEWSYHLYGGDLGMVVFAEEMEHPFDPILWWTPDVRSWQRLDDHPVLSGGRPLAAVSADAVVVASQAGFEAGEPVLYVATG